MPYNAYYFKCFHTPSSANTHGCQSEDTYGKVRYLQSMLRAVFGLFGACFSFKLSISSHELGTWPGFPALREIPPRPLCERGKGDLATPVPREVYRCCVVQFRSVER